MHRASELTPPATPPGRFAPRCSLAIFDLWPDAAGHWRGWRVTLGPFRQTRVAVFDLDALPAGAVVWIGGERWRPT